MKNLFANRTVFWRSVVLGGTVSAMFLTGCASGSRGLFSRSVGKKGDPKIAASTQGRDPFLDADDDRFASAASPGATAAKPGRKFRATDKRSPRGDVDSDGRSLSERFDRSRVAVTDATRSTAQRESPVSKLDDAPNNPFETALRRDVGKSASAAAPFPGGVTSTGGVAGGEESLIATASSGDARRPAQRRTVTVRPATMSQAVASHAVGHMPIVGSAPLSSGSHPEIEIRPRQQEHIEIQIIPRRTASASAIHGQSEPADVQRNGDVKSTAAHPVVQISATRNIGDVSGSEKVVEPEWRSMSLTVEKPFPPNPFDAHAVATPKKPVAPPAPVDAHPAMPSVKPANTPTAPLPSPAGKVNRPGAASAVSDSREADHAATNPAQEVAQGFAPPRRWVSVICLFAAVVLILRRLHRKAIVR